LTRRSRILLADKIDGGSLGISSTSQYHTRYPSGMATQRRSKTVNGGAATRPATPKVLVKKSYTPATGPVTQSPSIPRKSPMVTKPIVHKAASVEGELPAQKVSSAYYTMASRLANRFADLAENVTFVEK
jgi:hypothetical protein